ncbi:MAG: septum formation initiator family protein [Gemmatimonadota bacterium]
MHNRRVKTPRELRRQKVAFWSVCALLVAYAVLGGDYKLYHLLFLSSEKDRLERQIEDLRAENAVLAEEERRLLADTLLLERLAREKGMKRDGEIVYRLMPVQPPTASDGMAPADPDDPGTAQPVAPRAGDRESAEPAAPSP